VLTEIADAKLPNASAETLPHLAERRTPRDARAWWSSAWPSVPRRDDQLPENRHRATSLLLAARLARRVGVDVLASDEVATRTPQLTTITEAAAQRGGSAWGCGSAPPSDTDPR
jgi:hypothetical protein